jgi:hypothetical protein
MLNPLVKNRSYLIIYLAVWVSLMLIQTAILNYYQKLSLVSSLNDAVVFNGLLALIGFNIWYVLRFNMKDEQRNFAYWNCYYCHLVDEWLFFNAGSGTHQRSLP